MASKIVCPKCHALLAGMTPQPGQTVLCPSCRSRLAPAGSVAPRGGAESAPGSGRAETAGRSGTAEPAGPPLPRVGRFRVIRELGAGSFGRVFEAHDPDTDRRVALKVLHPGLLQERNIRDRFLREARAAARLRHPHIVPVLEARSADDTPYIASEFVAGATLQQRIAEAGPGGVAYRRAARWVRQLAEALAYAHGQKVVHRDVKPGNIMVDEAGDDVHLTDFGLAYREDLDPSVTKEGTIVGTPAYMAPEQATGGREGTGAASDQYSAGVVLYELLCGRVPFTGRLDQVLYLVRHQEPASPRKHRAGVPRDLETICLKAMAKAPGQRYGDCQALADDLRRWLEGEPIRARKVSVVERAWRWGRRNPLAAGLLAAFLVTLVSGAVLAAALAVRAGIKAKEALASEQAAVRQREQAEHNLYVAQMRLANRAWQEANVRQTLAYLDSQRPERTGGIDLRRFEWHYSHRLCFGAARILVGHKDTVNRVAVSRDGSRLATAGADGTVRLWDLASGQERLTFRGYERYVLGVAVAPDGKTVASVDHGGLLKVWRAADGAVLHTIRLSPHDKPDLAFSPDGGRLLYGGSGEQPGGPAAPGKSAAALQAWDVATGQLVLSLEGHTDLVNSVAYSPDGSRIASTSKDGTLRVWDAAAGRAVATVRGKFENPFWCFRSVCFSPDGQRVSAAVTEPDDEVVKVWDARDGRELLTFRGLGKVERLAFRPDGRQQLGVVGLEVRTWDAASGRLHRSFKGHLFGVTDACYAPDGASLVSAGHDASARVWLTDVDSEKVHLDSHLAAVGFSPDGERVVGVSPFEEQVYAWSPATGQKTGRVPFVDAEAPPGVGGAALPPGVKGVSMATRVVLSPHAGNFLVPGPEVPLFGSPGGPPVEVRDAATGRVTARLAVARGQGIPLGLSPDGRRAATGGRGRVTLWDLPDGREVSAVDAAVYPEFSSFAFTPDGGRVAICKGQPSVRVVVVDAATGEEVASSDDHHFAIAALAFSPDGTTLASADFTGDVFFADARTGRRTATLIGHGQPVTCLAFSPDGTRLVSGDMSGIMKIWDVELRQELMSHRVAGVMLTQAAFSPDGQRLVVRDASGSAYLFDGSPLP